MSYTRTIINGSSVSKEGGSSFDEELADLQDQIDGIGSGSVPTGTGLRHVTSGVEDGTAYTLSAADIPNLAASKITTGQMALARGGTGADLSASGASTHFLAQAADHSVSARAIAKTDMPFTGTPDGTKFLKDDQSWGTVSATNNTGEITRIARITSAQTGVSGSFAVDYIDFNSVISSDGSHWVRTSAGLYTCDVAAEWLIIQHTYGLNSAYLDFVQNNTARDELIGPIDGSYRQAIWRVKTAANDTVRIQITSSNTSTVPSTDGSRPNKVNLLEIIRIK